MSQVNGVMMQYFHWYIDPDSILWNEIRNKAAELAAAGFTAMWLPPAYKGFAGGYDVGYGVYDLYDLGEFEQKGSTRTKYGTRQQYLAAIQALQQSGMQVYADGVLNHRMGGDSTEIIKATPFSQGDRLNPKGGMREIESYTHYTFPGRGGEHSKFEWHWWHFDAVDYDKRTGDSNSIYLFEGKQFDDYVALENGNFAYLMGCDVDFQMQEVREEIIRWGKWYLDTTKADGFRLDAIKHISSWFFPEWIDTLERYTGKDLYVVGEYWYNDIGTLHWYVDAVQGKMAVFDVPLHYNFYAASKSGGHYDLRRILDGTMMQQRPTHAVTFVENARREYAYGDQYDYFDHFNTIGWTRLGDAEHPEGMAVIMSDGAAGSKWMEVGKPNAKFYDLTEHIQEPVYTNESGWGEFFCLGGSVSVWVRA